MMKQNKLSKRALQALTAFGMVAGLGLGLRSTPAIAQPSSMVTYEFYSDDTFSEGVGLRVANSCYGVVNKLYGESTPYVIKSIDSCHHSNPPVLSHWYCPDIECEHIDGVLTCELGPCELM